MKKQLLSFAAVATISGGLAAQAHAADDYVVNKGDTLWGISQDNGVTVNQLKQWNNLDSNLIYPNDKLTVSATNNAEANQSSKYTVKSGDTLWGISQEYGVTVDQLMAWNNLSSTTIFPGDTFAVSGNGQAQASAEKETTAKAEASTEKSESKEQGEAVTTAATTSSDSGQDDVAKEMNMIATAYTANCTGCSGTTYTGIDLKANPDKKVIAVDPDVIPLGSEVYVEGYGYAVAGDIGSAIQGNKIDVFIPNKSDALNWGVKTVNVKVLD
ncbi:LysM peptidoglycan-binding and 3D domain-containing protein [Thalassobacillus hwangdonensis]|uniref:LysM peptidoglycan-binding domain-containing protein n=1 Tax=Thalassobacillus hwangdonensis TaxID=546108 RepID=A0ABW3KZ53_9BACI